MSRTANRNDGFNERGAKTQCRAFAVDACDKLYEAPEGFGNRLNIEFDDRELGPLVEATWDPPSKQGTLNVSKPRWSKSTDHQRLLAVIAGTCHLVVDANNFKMESLDPSMLDLCGHHVPADNPNWDEFTAKNVEVVRQACKALEIEDVAPRISLEWNGRLKRRLATIDWDEDKRYGTICLAKKLWPMLSEDEQEEAIIQAVCNMVRTAKPNLAKQLPPPQRQTRSGNVLMAHCGYATQRSPLVFGPGLSVVFPPNRINICQRTFKITRLV